MATILGRASRRILCTPKSTRIAAVMPKKSRHGQVPASSVAKIPIVPGWETVIFKQQLASCDMSSPCDVCVLGLLVVSGLFRDPHADSSQSLCMLCR